MDTTCVGNVGSDEKELEFRERYPRCLKKGGSICGMTEDIHPWQFQLAA